MFKDLRNIFSQHAEECRNMANKNAQAGNKERADRWQRKADKYQKLASNSDNLDEFDTLDGFQETTADASSYSDEYLRIQLGE